MQQTKLKKGQLGRVLDKMGLFLVLLVFILIMSVLTPSFLTWNNMRKMCIRDRYCEGKVKRTPGGECKRT